jgi:hypothetical protein
MQEYSIDYFGALRGDTKNLRLAITNMRLKRSHIKANGIKDNLNFINMNSILELMVTHIKTLKSWELWPVAVTSFIINIAIARFVVIVAIIIIIVITGQVTAISRRTFITIRKKSCLNVIISTQLTRKFINIPNQGI